MKRFIAAAALFICGALLSGVVFVYTDAAELLKGGEKNPVTVMSAAGSIDTDTDDSLLTDALSVAGSIQDRDFIRLSQWIEPELGVYFIPYSTVKETENQHFLPEDVKNFGSSKQLYVWGTVDCEGSPISMTPSEYFERYVYDYDFRDAPVIGINTVVKSGNTLENVKDAFPDAEFVELHYPGSSEYDGMDWKSLKLVFSNAGGSRKLIAVIHSEWTA